MVSGIEFDEDTSSYVRKPTGQHNAGAPGSFPGAQNFAESRYPGSSTESAMVRFLIKHHLASSPQTAQIYLIAIVIINIIVTFVVIKFLL